MHETLSQEVEATALSVDAEGLLFAPELVIKNIFRTQRPKYTIFCVWLVASMSGYGVFQSYWYSMPHPDRAMLTAL